MHAAYRGTRILIGRCRHRASIKNYDFRAACVVRAFESAILELALKGGAIGLGGTAPKILYVKSRHSTIVATFDGKMALWAAVQSKFLPALTASAPGFTNFKYVPACAAG
jgi:hypothetical protein